MADKGSTTRVLVSKHNLTINEDGRAARSQYPVFQEDTQNVVFLIPEEDAEEVAQKLGGLVSMSESE